MIMAVLTAPMMVIMKMPKLSPTPTESVRSWSWNEQEWSNTIDNALKQDEPKHQHPAEREGNSKDSNDQERRHPCGDKVLEHLDSRV